MSAEQSKLEADGHADLGSRLRLLLAHFLKTAAGRGMIASFEITVTGADDELILLCQADADGLSASSDSLNSVPLDARYPLTATLVDTKGVEVEWTIARRTKQ
jgi:hypothetical protein